MRFAVNLPNFGDLADPRLVVELAVRAETAGWDGFFVWDHIVIGDGVPVGDPFVQLAAVAQATERITIGTMVTPIPRRRPWVLARQTVSLDHLSGGRFVLGVGLGTPPEIEFGTFGEPTEDRHRAELLDEGLDIIRGMWGGGPFEYHGRHFTVRETTFGPAPLGRIPIWVAGLWPHRRPFRRAARFDGVFPIRADMDVIRPADVSAVVEYVRALRTGADPFDVTVGGPPAPYVASYAEAGLTWYQAGPGPADDLAEIRGMIDAGPTG
jgi:alkanesulfonate monooxygenase SsuD/methylene tetrahydromethanopterin reductase-like flavin-dependent oxidoreductase (luciferase family)